jgi:hypothetical protein
VPKTTKTAAKPVTNPAGNPAMAASAVSVATVKMVKMGTAAVVSAVAAAATVKMGTAAAVSAAVSAVSAVVSAVVSATTVKMGTADAATMDIPPSADSTAKTAARSVIPAARCQQSVILAARGPKRK